MNKFAFVAHALTREHLYETLGGFKGKMVSLLPRDILEKILLKGPPFKFGACKNVKSKTGLIIEGLGIICSLLPNQLLRLDEKFVLKKIAEGINRAKKERAQIISLGGFASVVGNEGYELSKVFKDIALTSGNTCTATLAIEGIVKASDILEIDLKDSTMTIIGATGDIGSICSKIFSKKVKKLNIVARDEKRLREFGDVLKKYQSAEIEAFKLSKEAIKKSDIILTTTTALTSLIEPSYLKPGVIVCDVSLPANVPREILEVRDDIFVFEGGLTKLPYYREVQGKNWNRLLPGDRTYGCLAEAMLLAFEGRFENYSLGRGNITEDKVWEMSRLLKKHGFELSDFFCGHKFLSKDDIENIKGARRKEKINAGIL